MGTAWMTPERFFAKAVRQGECLIWQGKGRIGPYGTAGYQGVGWLAHRLSYHLTHGSIPDGAVVRHTCDTPLCVEPSHLLAGTHADNVNDKVERGRQRRGEGHPMAKISLDLVEQIRAEYAAGGVMQKDLAAKHGISTTQISRIVRGTRWKKGD